MSVSTGTVTFLFTDIEGSTQLWEKAPEAMRMALARHDEIVRRAIESNGGAVFKTIGDAFCATFASAVDGLKATEAAQKALRTEVWPEPLTIKVRMALHSGIVEARDNDFFGQTVNRVARLLSVAHGGQTIISESTHSLVADNVPGDIGLRDLGEHRLKDLSRPERVFQVESPGFSSDFPPLRSLDSAFTPNNLPAQVTTFVGRQNEITRVSNLLETSRIVTLTGSGGCGKTRLALQVAAEASGTFPGGVWFVELASLTDPNLVLQSLASILGVREEPGMTISQSLVATLRKKKALILLDNCEHVLLPSAQLAESILRACPEVKIMVTSREAMNIPGEATFRVPSLTLPDPKRDTTPADVEQYDSVRLFSDRAKAVSANFEVTRSNCSSLAQLCHQLDGIPLAIELAAARVRSLSVEQIADRLDDRFKLLTGGSRTALPRQQTLRALVDWSYDLLLESERAVLRRLSVFSGGWSLNAAENVVAGDPVEDWEVLDVMTSLVDKSLVMFDPTKADGRYRLLETVKRYGREKLAECNEEDASRKRHLAWYARLVDEAGYWSRGPNQLEWLSRLDVEHDNLWSALETSLEEGDATTSGRLAWTIGAMLLYRGFLNESVRAIETGMKGFHEESGRDSSTLAWLEYERAGLHYDFGEADEARTMAQSALSRFQSQNDKVGEARAENLLGQIAMGEREFDEAAELFERSLAIFQESEDRLGESIVLNNKGVLARRSETSSDSDRVRRLAQAREFLNEALEIRRKYQDLLGEAETLNNLGVISFESHDFDAAWDNYLRALEIERQLKRTPGIGTALANLGEVAGIRGERERAMRLMAVSERILEDIKSPLAGAVHSMLLDLAGPDGLAEVGDHLSRARSLPVDIVIDKALSENRPDDG